jgi:hypothetical protein
MKYRVKLLQSLPTRVPRAVQAHFRLADGTAQTWPVFVEPDHGAAELVVESGRDMLVAEVRARTLVAHYVEPPFREERQISAILAE